jgi:hypothetical protein
MEMSSRTPDSALGNNRNNNNNEIEDMINKGFINSPASDQDDNCSASLDDVMLSFAARFSISSIALSAARFSRNSSQVLETSDLDLSERSAYV